MSLDFCTIFFPVLIVLFSNTALFSFLFRTVLVRFSHRGLVLQGRPNLRLFDQLFWVVLVAYCAVGFVMTFGVALIKDKFHTDFGFKVCTLRSISDHDVWRKNVMPLFSPFLVWTTCMYYKFKTNQYLRRICPQQKMFILGNFRRNFITFEQTTQFMHVYFFYGIVHYGIFFSLVQAFSLEPQTNFLLSIISDYLYMNIFLGIVLPMIIEIPPTLNTNRQGDAADFFVRKPQLLEPRRPEEQNSTRRAVCWAEEQTDKRTKRRKGDRSLSTELHREQKKLYRKTTVIQVLPRYISSCEEETTESHQNPL